MKEHISRTSALDKRVMPDGEFEKRKDFLRSQMGIDSNKVEHLASFRHQLYPIESSIRSAEHLLEVGFVDPKKAIVKAPSIAAYESNTIDHKIKGMIERGFKNPVNDIFRKFPEALGLGLENIDQKITGLKERGFTNPIKVIEGNPQVLGYSLAENIDPQIQGLAARQFNDPIKMLENNPKLFGYSLEKNIDPKIKYFKRLNDLYQLGLNPTSIVEQNPKMLGTSFKKIMIICRILRDYHVTPEDITRKFSNIFKQNIESLIISYSQRQPGDTIDMLTRVSNRVQNQKMTSEYKREVINSYFSSHPQDKKVFQLYHRGYIEKPEKTA